MFQRRHVLKIAMGLAKAMLFRNLLFLCFCVVVAAGIGLYVYHTHAYVVWALLFLCWVVFRLKMRADSLFGERSRETLTVASSGHKGGEVQGQDAAH